MVTRIQNEIASLEDKAQIILTGDFNFPTANWMHGDLYYGGNHPQLGAMNGLIDKHYLM